MAENRFAKYASGAGTVTPPEPPTNRFAKYSDGSPQSAPAQPAGLPQRRDPFSYSPAETERMQDAFVANEGTVGTRVKEQLNRSFNPRSGIAPADSVSDFATRVLPRSIAGLTPKVVKGAYDAIKGQTDPLIEGLADTTDPNGLTHMRQKMETNAANAVKGAGAAMLSGLGFGMDHDNNVNWSLDNAKNAWLSDPAMAAAGLAPMVKPAAGLVKAGLPEVRPLEAVAKASGKAANKLTEMTLKQSTTLKPAVRAQNVETMHELGVLPNSKGVDTLNATIANTERQLRDGIANGDAANVRGTLDKAIANIESLRDKADRSSDPVKNHAILDAEISRLRNHPLLEGGTPPPQTFSDFAAGKMGAYMKEEGSHGAAMQRLSREYKQHVADNPVGVGGTIDIGTLQKMKVEQGQEIQKKYGQPGYDDFTTSVDKARVRGLKEELESQLDEAFPELAATNKKLGQYYDLKKSLERAANRISNREGIGISAPVKMGGGAAIGNIFGPGGAAVGGAIGTLVGVIEHPSVAPRLARQLYNLSKGAMTYSQALADVRARLTGLADKKNADIAFEGYDAPDNPEAYDPSQRTPGATAPELERNATPEQPLGYGERELRPGLDTSATPELIDDQRASRLRQMAVGFPKGEPAPAAPLKPGAAADRLYLHRSRRDAAKDMK